MKRLWVILGVLLIGLAVGIGLYLWFPTTPVYTLTQVKKSVLTHDWEAFTRHVDVDVLADSAARDVAAIMQGTMEQKKVSKLLTKTLSALIAIKVRSSLHADLKNWVTGEDPGKKGLLSSLLPREPKGVTLRLKSVRWRGDAGRARVAIGTDTVLELELTKHGGMWRVSRVLNVGELYEKSRAKKSPS